jgi:hypothetical protein
MRDFDNIMDKGIQYTLPCEVIHNLQDLQKKLGIVAVSQKPVPRRAAEWTPPLRERTQNDAIEKEFLMKKEATSATASATASLTVASLTETKEALLATDLAAIRISLNKISLKNYETQSQNIIKTIEPYIAADDADSLLHFAQTIFDISSKNTFLSELNAKLYKALIGVCPHFSGVVAGFIEDYKKTYELETFGLVSDEEERKKQDDKRKAMTKFIVNLMKEGVFEVNTVLSCVNELFEKLYLYVDCKNHTHLVDEITENLFLFITLGQSLFAETEEWDSLYQHICVFGEMKSKEKAGLSNRAIFKFKDLLDFL